MNLIKLFSIKYMKENIKKSKALLIFFLGIIPLISPIILLLYAKFSNPSLINLEKISILNYVGIYIIPIILSISLFGFVYKKKTVDFTMSMPLSRKTIFITNTITGIILLTSMVLISGLAIYIASIFTSLIIPIEMILNYLLIWIITYIYVFVLSNIALSISGNITTHIIVTIILLLAIPFTIDYLFKYNELGGCFLTLDLLENGTTVSTRYPLDNSIVHTSYTIPYNIISGFIRYEYTLYDLTSIIKMIIISVISIIIGLFLFKKRKMEDNETSFKSIIFHNLVKLLTIIPLCAIICYLFNSNDNNIIKLLIIIFFIIYSFIYDLFTKKHTYLIDSICCNIGILLIIYLMFLMPGSLSYREQYSEHYGIETSDITGYKISLTESYFDEFSYIDVKDKEYINKITELLKIDKENITNKDNVIDGSIDTSNSKYEVIIIETKNKEYKISSYVDSDTYDEILSELKNINALENTKTLADSNYVYAVGYKDLNFYTMTSNKNIINEAKKLSKYKDDCDSSDIITLYSYHNGILNTTDISVCSNDTLIKYIEDARNLENKKLINDIKYKSYSTATNTMGINNIYFSDMTDNDRSNIHDNLEAIYNLVKKYKNDKFTISKEYFILEIVHDGGDFYYYSNRIDELKEILREVDTDVVN